MQKLIKTTCKIAEEDIGKERAGHIAEIAQIRYQELCLENASDSKALRAHTFKRIYPAIAVYEALKEDGIDQEKAAWYSVTADTRRNHIQKTEKGHDEKRANQKRLQAVRQQGRLL